MVIVPACHAKDRVFNSRHSHYMQIASFRRAMQRETIPDTKKRECENLNEFNCNRFD